MDKTALASIRHWWSHFAWSIATALGVSYAVSHWLDGSLFGCPAWACGLIVAVAYGTSTVCSWLFLLSTVTGLHSDRATPLLEELVQQGRANAFQSSLGERPARKVLHG